MDLETTMAHSFYSMPSVAIASFFGKVTEDPETKVKAQSKFLKKTTKSQNEASTLCWPTAIFWDAPQSAADASTQLFLSRTVNLKFGLLPLIGAIEKARILESAYIPYG